MDDNDRRPASPKATIISSLLGSRSRHFDEESATSSEEFLQESLVEPARDSSVAEFEDDRLNNGQSDEPRNDSNSLEVQCRILSEEVELLSEQLKGKNCGASFERLENGLHYVLRNDILPETMHALQQQLDAPTTSTSANTDIQSIALPVQECMKYLNACETLLLGVSREVCPELASELISNWESFAMWLTRLAQLARLGSKVDCLSAMGMAAEKVNFRPLFSTPKLIFQFSNENFPGSESESGNAGGDQEDRGDGGVKKGDEEVSTKENSSLTTGPHFSIVSYVNSLRRRENRDLHQTPIESGPTSENEHRRQNEGTIVSV